MVPVHSQHRLHSSLLAAGNTRQVDWPGSKVNPKELPHEHPGSCSRTFPTPDPPPPTRAVLSLGLGSLGNTLRLK